VKLDYPLLLHRVADLLMHLPRFLLAVRRAVLPILALSTSHQHRAFLSSLETTATTQVRVVVLVTELLDDLRSSGVAHTSIEYTARSNDVHANDTTRTWLAVGLHSHLLETLDFEIVWHTVLEAVRTEERLLHLLESDWHKPTFAIDLLEHADVGFGELATESHSTGTEQNVDVAWVVPLVLFRDSEKLGFLARNQLCEDA